MTPATLLFRVAVTGASMEPTLRDGDWLLVRRVSGRAAPPRVGELIVANDPRAPGRLLLKRVAAVDRGSLLVVGDRPEASTDSRHFGPLPLGSVVGRPLLRYAPLSRFGRVR